MRSRQLLGQANETVLQYSMCCDRTLNSYTLGDKITLSQIHQTKLLHKNFEHSADDAGKLHQNNIFKTA